MHMNLNRSKTTICLFSLLISFCILSSYTGRTTSWSDFYGSVFPLAGAFLIAALVVVAVRTTVLTWITVLVLLAFVGKRRRVLVTEGRKITTDVAMYLAKVLLKERSLLAVAGATIVSLMALAFA